MAAQGGSSRWRPTRGDGRSRPSSPAPTWDDAALTAARAGDLRAWGYLVRCHQDLVFRTAWLVTRDTTMAEEATRAALVRAFRSLRSLDADEPLRPWLMGVTAGVARSLVREAGRVRDAKLPDPDPAPRLPALVRVDPTLPRPLPSEEAVLHDAFDGLTDQDRLVLMSRYRFGLRRSEAAALLGIPDAEADVGLAATASRLRRRVEEAVARAPERANPNGTAPAGPVDRLLALSDDKLAALAVAVALASPPWTPDVAARVCDRLAREAAAYPEHQARTAAGEPGADSQHARGASTVDGVSTTPTRRPPGPPARGRGSGVLPMAISAIVVVSALVGLALVTETPRVPDGASTPTAAPVGVLMAGADTRATTAGSGTPDADGVVVAPPVASPPPQAGPPAPDLSIVGSRLLGGGSLGARVSLDWTPQAGSDAVVHTWLERKVDDGPWQRVDQASPAEPLAATIRPGRDYRFRVRSHGEAGSVAVSPTVLVGLEIRDPRSEALALRSDDWVTRYGNTIKRRLIATSPEASLSTAFQGNHVALVGPTGPTRGAFGVRIDGGTWTSDDLRVRDSSTQAMLFSEELASGLHWLDLRAEAEGLAVDAVLIVNTLARPSAG